MSDRHIFATSSTAVMQRNGTATGEKTRLVRLTWMIAKLMRNGFSAAVLAEAGLRIATRRPCARGSHVDYVLLEFDADAAVA